MIAKIRNLFRKKEQNKVLQWEKARSLVEKYNDSVAKQNEANLLSCEQRAKTLPKKRYTFTFNNGVKGTLTQRYGVLEFPRYISTINPLPEQLTKLAKENGVLEEVTSLFMRREVTEIREHTIVPSFDIHDVRAMRFVRLDDEVEYNMNELFSIKEETL